MNKRYMKRYQNACNEVIPGIRRGRREESLRALRVDGAIQHGGARMQRNRRLAPGPDRRTPERGRTAKPNVIARKPQALQKKGAIRSVDVATVLQIRPETVSRWNQGKAFPQPEAERTLLDLEYVVDQLADLYEPDEARMWLFSRQRLLDGAIPAQLIQKHRTEEVLGLLRRVRDGVFM